MPPISIHALLAESDNISAPKTAKNSNFYPRSPCGERPAAIYRRSGMTDISIHALLAESDTIMDNVIFVPGQFLSTLSLRRATAQDFTTLYNILISIHALLAESDTLVQIIMSGYARISIHALLAESDGGLKVIVFSITHFYPRSPCGERRFQLWGACRRVYFYPRSPCGERLCSSLIITSFSVISIHALLAESDYGLRREV